MVRNANDFIKKESEIIKPYLIKPYIYEQQGRKIKLPSYKNTCR